MLGFARIGDSQGRHALIVNKGRLTRGKGRILSPIGGSFEYRPLGRTHLTALGARDFEGDLQNPTTSDLCFRAPDNRVEDVVTWFGQRNDRERELTVHREMVEELTIETNILTPDLLRGYRGGYAGFFRSDATTTREDVPEKLTAYLIETFDVVPRPEAMQALLAAARVPIDRRWVHFVTPAEIQAGVTRDGVQINPISRYVI